MDISPKPPSAQHSLFFWVGERRIELYSNFSPCHVLSKPFRTKEILLAISVGLLFLWKRGFKRDHKEKMLLHESRVRGEVNNGAIELLFAWREVTRRSELPWAACGGTEALAGCILLCSRSLLSKWDATLLPAQWVPVGAGCSRGSKSILS